MKLVKRGWWLSANNFCPDSRRKMILMRMEKACAKTRSVKTITGCEDNSIIYNFSMLVFSCVLGLRCLIGGETTLKIWSTNWIDKLSFQPGASS